MDITRRRNLTAAIPSPLLRNSNRFEELGTFDEEQCRFFLREVGERVVPVYPFSFGMEEVYSLILERYGYAGLPDATSVLQDLLESDGTAGGLGDDGDVWRSWRHSWRHRNADALNPFIPKVGSFILQPPTLPHIRKIKALNFIQKAEEREKRHHARRAEATGKRRALYEISPTQNRVSSAPVARNVKHQGSDDEDSYQLPATTYSPQKPRALLSSGRVSPSSGQADMRRPSKVSSQQDFAEVDPFLLDAEIDPSLSITFKMLSNQDDSHGPTMRGGHGETVTLQQVSSRESPASNKQNTLPSSSPLPRIKSSPLRIFSSGTPPSRVKPATSAHSSRVVSEPLHALGREETQGSAEREKSVERLRKLSDGLRPFARRPVGDNSERSKRNRADNRQVRILDGVILNPKVRQRLSSPPSTAAEDGSRIDERKKSVVRRSLTPVWQKRDSSRNSLTEVMRNFFRTEASSSRATKQSKRESPNLSHTVATPSVAPPSSDTINDNRTQTVPREQPSSLLGLDGTLDLPTFAPNTFISAPKTLISKMLRARFDRDKPLPPNPSEIVRSLSALPGFPASHQLPQNNPARFDGGTTSTGGRHNLYALTAHALERKGIPDTHQFLPAYQDLGDRRGHPAQEPTKNVDPRISQLTYSSVMNANPFASPQNSPNPIVQAPPAFRVGTSSTDLRWDPFASNSSSPNPIPPMEPVREPEKAGFTQSQSAPEPYSSTLMQASKLNPQATVFTPFKKFINKHSLFKDTNVAAPAGESPGNRHSRQSSLGKLKALLKGPFTDQAPIEAEKVEERMPMSAQVSVPDPIISLAPSSQAAILGQLESILITAVNEFLIHNAHTNRLRSDIVMRSTADHKLKGLPAVVDFLYDCRTQLNLVLNHRQTVDFNSAYAANQQLFKSTIDAWGSLVSLLSCRVLCLPDAVINGHLYALKGVLNLVRARDPHHVALESLQMKVHHELADRHSALANMARRG